MWCLRVPGASSSRLTEVLEVCKTQERKLIRFFALWAASRFSYSHVVRYKTQDDTIFQMHQGYKTFRVTKVSFAASPISLTMSRRELGQQLSGQARYTHGMALRTTPAAASRYVQRARGTRARSCLGVALGWGARVIR